MALFRKKTEAGPEIPAVQEKKDYTPIRHIAGSVMDCKKQLVEKEVDSLEELRYIHESFEEVL